jgi:aminoglycoside 3-N-acetyltransferase
MLDRGDLVAAFQAAGIGPGALVMLHSDALVLTQIAGTDREAALFQALDEALGPDGTLVLPCFSYSATKGEVFDPAATPGTVGMLPEYFRTLPGVVRTSHPIFSMAVRGRLAAEFLAAPVEDCFGPDTIFDLFHRHGGVIACLGCGFDRITFVHYAEQRLGVDYRYFKHFPARIIEANRERMLDTRYFVRDLGRQSETDLRRLKSALQARGQLRLVPVGRAGLTTVRAADFLETAAALLAEDPAALIREGAVS